MTKYLLHQVESHCLSECGKTCKQVNIQRSYNAQLKSLKMHPINSGTFSVTSLAFGMRHRRLHWLRLRQALWHEGHHHHLRRAFEKTMMTCLLQHVGTKGLHQHLRRLHQHHIRQTPFIGGPLQTSSANHNDMPPPTLHRCLR
jgi:hypothetical protein